MESDKFECQNGWTKEKIISRIREKMLDHPSKLPNGACVYRAPDGNCCAVGTFIEDEDYEPEWDSTTAWPSGCPVDEIWGSVEHTMPLNLTAMDLLQNVHDELDLHVDPRPALEAWIEEHVE